MPPRILKDLLIVDQSPLAKSMYPLLFTSALRFRIRFGDEYESLAKRSPRLRPDLLIINSNTLSRQASGEVYSFPCPALIILSRDRFDLKETLSGVPGVLLVEKPFYPYDLIALANRLIHQPKVSRRGRKRKVQ